MDSARKDLDGLTARSRELSNQLASAADALPQVVDPTERVQLEQHTRALKQELETVAMQEQQARARDGELYQMLQVEEARWSDLISRLEQLIKR